MRGALFQKEQNCFESGLLIFHPNFRGSFLEKRFHLNIPIYVHFVTKNATSELPSLLFFASKLFNLADWRYRFCIVPTFCFHNVSSWILKGNPTYSVDMWFVFLHWLSFRWPSKNRMVAMTIGQLNFMTWTWMLQGKAPHLQVCFYMLFSIVRSFTTICHTRHWLQSVCHASLRIVLTPHK